MAGLALGLISAACDPGNKLEGSINEVYDLDFDFIRVRKQSETLLIEYIKEITGGENKALKIVLEGHALLDENQVPIPLVGGLTVEGEDFHRTVTISRVTPTGSDFPPVENGILRFGRLIFEDGGEVHGSFDIAFENGRTMSGTFVGRIEEIDLS